MSKVRRPFEERITFGLWNYCDSFRYIACGTHGECYHTTRINVIPDSCFYKRIRFFCLYANFHEDNSLRSLGERLVNYEYEDRGERLQ